MSIQEELATTIHGLPAGVVNNGVFCDLPHEPDRPVDTSRRIQYECARLDESITMYQGIDDDWYDRWVPDLLRCAECEIASLEDPTDGFGEALVELSITRSQTGVYTIDARDLEVLEYSPADAGQAPPPIPGPVFETTLEYNEPSLIRRSRLAILADQYRRRGATELAEQLEESLAVEL